MNLKDWTDLVGKVIGIATHPGELFEVFDYNQKNGEVVLKSDYFNKTSSMGPYRVIPAPAVKKLIVTSVA